MERHLAASKHEFNHKLISLVLPIAFQQFMLATVSASDAVMLGMIDQDSLSAVSLAGQVQFVFSLFLAAMTIGASMLAAQYWGKGDKAAVEKILAFVLRLTMVVSAAFFAAALICPARLMRIFTPDPVLIADGVIYLRAVSLSYLLCGASQIYLCIMKNSGRTLQSTIISSAAVVINIIFNAILIFGLLGAPKMGIAGAAAATVIARIVELAAAFWDSRKEGRIKLRLKYFVHADKPLQKDFWKYTTPVLGNELVWGCGFTMYSVIMGHLGSDAVAANSIANIVKNLVSCFCLGLGSGGGIMVGNALGAGMLEKAKTFGGWLCKLSILSGALSGVFLLILTPLILRFSNLTPTANTYLTWMLVMCSCYMVGRSVNGATIAGIFCAGGDSKFGFLCDTITLWVITVPLGLIAAFVLKLPVLAVYFIINLDEMIKLPAVYHHYKKYKWVKDLTVKS
ncbi:MAG: MATE family efflux transporter [Clostridia bacterium]|nr:MATE family efflux transporter [Clostridia bacterium]NCC42268.1 MATE family efflux transporter [Clostridia bacterium]